MTTFQDRIRATLAIDPDAPAIEFRGEWLTWGDLRRSVEAVDATLDAVGLPADGAAGIILRNTPQHAAAILSLFASDRCLVTLNAYYPDETLAADIRKLRPSVIIAASADWARSGLKEVAAEIGAAGVELTGDPALPARAIAGLERIVGADHFVPDPDVVVYMLTSGTTGPQKRVPLTRTRVLKSLEWGMRFERSRSLGDAPALRKTVQIHHAAFVHVSGLWGFVNAVMGGFRISMLEKFTVPEFRRAVTAHRPRAASLPPAAIRMLLDSDVTREELSSLVALRAGTAALPPDLQDEAMERWGIPILANYGSTEFTGVAGWSIDQYRQFYPAKRGAVGKLNADYEARIRDEATDEILPRGREGVLELRTEAIWNGEWVRTTDRAILDEDDFLWITGRLDNAINRGGFKVHGEDIQTVLEQHPAVREAVVVGIPDRRLGQAPAAAVVLAQGAALTAEDLRAWARERLLPYQTPETFRFVDELPRTPSLKPMLPAIRALFET